ncbi:NDC80 [Candida theae]|uniref:Kinetochore protein NDC80 n=1 Tax=Candida theae TaxID=1198502 RepID=A0AAD5FW44_9ASCO|nr:NDC80 [Candida theae]KAI5948747.1 NDC80 [Candida theae]
MSQSTNAPPLKPLFPLRKQQRFTNGGTRLSLGTASRSSTTNSTAGMTPPIANSYGRRLSTGANGNVPQANPRQSFQTSVQSSTLHDNTPSTGNKRRSVLYSVPASTNKKRASLGIPSSQVSQSTNAPRTSFQASQELQQRQSQSQSQQPYPNRQIHSSQPTPSSSQSLPFQSHIPQPQFGALHSLSTDRALNRARQEEMTQRIYAFLAKNHFEVKTSISLNENTLKIPTQRNFYEIFKFMYQFINPFYSFHKSAEQEIIPILKGLQYPALGTISRLQFNAVGGQNWPNFLAILEWILILVESNADDVNVDVDTDDLSPNDDFDRIFMKFNYNCYLKFLNADEDYEALHQQMLAEFDEEMKNYRSQEDNLITQKNKLEENIKRLLNELRLRDDADRKTIALEEDFTKLRQYIEEVQKRIPEWAAKLHQLSDEVHAASENLTSLQEEREMLKREFQVKGISIEAILDLEVKRDKLLKKVEQETINLEEKKDHLQERIADVENATFVMEKLVSSYNISVERFNYHNSGDYNFGLQLKDLSDFSIAYERDELFKDKTLGEESHQLNSLLSSNLSKLARNQEEIADLKSQFSSMEDKIKNQHEVLDELQKAEYDQKSKNDGISQEIYNLQAQMSQDIESREKRIRDTNSSITRDILHYERAIQNTHLQKKIAIQHVQQKQLELDEQISKVHANATKFKTSLVERLISAFDDLSLSSNS